MTCPSARCHTANATAAPAETPEAETVLLLHGSAGSSALWRRTVAALRPLYRALAPDLIGYGASTAWSSDASFGLDAEAQALKTLLPCCGGRYHLVGYSYGGVVALHMALANPHRVLSLTLIEPVFFAALRYAGETAAYDELCRMRDAFAAALARGERALAMQRFIEFWTGEGAWTALLPAMRDAMLKMADKIVLDWQASFAADPGPDALAALAPLTKLLRGDGSPAPMQCLVEALHRLMPGSERIIVPGANHLLPLSHASAITDAIMTQLLASAERRLR